MFIVQVVPIARLEEAVSVLADAFHDYPVMRFVVGEGHADYDERLRRLVRFFTFRRARMGAPLLAIADGESLVAAAALTLPIEPPVPPDVVEHRAALWADLGDAARLRYETYAEAARPLTVAAPHHHLNMIGVRRSHWGRGFTRPLLERVAQLSRDDAGSAGVSLTTEVPRNLTLY